MSTDAADDTGPLAPEEERALARCRAHPDALRAIREEPAKRAEFRRFLASVARTIATHAPATRTPPRP